MLGGDGAEGATDVAHVCGLPGPAVGVGAAGGGMCSVAGIGMTVIVWIGGGDGGAPIGLVRVHVVGCGPQTVQTVIVVVKPSGHPVPVVVEVAPKTEVMVLTVRQGTVVNPVLQMSVYVIVSVVVIVVVLGSGHPIGVVVDVKAGPTGCQDGQDMVDRLEVAKLELDELEKLAVVALVVTAPAVVEDEPVVDALDVALELVVEVEIEEVV